MEILFLITICTVIVIFSQGLYSNVGISLYVGTVGRVLWLILAYVWWGCVWEMWYIISPI